MNSSSIYPEHHAEHTTPFHHPPSLSSHSNRSPMSMLLHKTIDSKRTLLCNSFYHTGMPNSTMSDSGLVELQYNLSKGNSMELLSPTDHFLTEGSPSDAQDWPLGDCHKAKRARVENIIRGMAGSPGGHFIDERQKAHLQELKSIQENKKKQQSQIQDHIDSRGSSTSSRSKEGQTLRKQLQTMQKVEKRIQVYMTNECEEEVSRETSSTGVLEEDNNTWSKAFPETTMSGVPTDPCSVFDKSLDRTHLGRKKIKLMAYNHSKPENENKLLADILKYELSRAVSKSVDSIFKNIAHSLLASQQVQVENEGVKIDDEALYQSTCKPPSNLEVGMTRLHPCPASAPGRQLPGVQTEALSLVVKKAALASPGSVNFTENHQPTVYDYSTVPQEDQLLENLKHNSQGAFGGLQCGFPSMGQSALGLVDLPWDPVRVRSKVTSRPVRGHQAHPLAMGHVVLDKLCLPHVKIECGTLQNMVKKHSYVLNEGLTTSHLKKAKLMFFYTRYPSSTVLKTFFPDVQFTRCITSQLIKWFSNFREFYYIQMEKFARHALMEGVTNVRELTVGRHSELFRAINLHYNKANDFQVPERFLEVAGITLQEFYIAISLAKDSEPSWKKAIYKVICKLDSDVPTEFKAPLLTVENSGSK